MTNSAKVSVSATSGTTVVRLRGEHELSNKDDVESALHRAGQSRQLIVDLTETVFIGAAVRSALVRTATRRAAADRQFIVVASPGSFPRRVLDFFGLGRIVTPTATGSGAQSAVGASSAAAGSELASTVSPSAIAAHRLELYLNQFGENVYLSSLPMVIDEIAADAAGGDPDEQKMLIAELRLRAGLHV